MIVINQDSSICNFICNIGCKFWVDHLSSWCVIPTIVAGSTIYLWSGVFITCSCSTWCCRLWSGCVKTCLTVLSYFGVWKHASLLWPSFWCVKTCLSVISLILVFDKMPHCCLWFWCVKTCLRNSVWFWYVCNTYLILSVLVQNLFYLFSVGWEKFCWICVSLPFDFLDMSQSCCQMLWNIIQLAKCSS